MSTAIMTERIAEASPRLKASIAGVFYLLTFLTGGVALFVRGRLGSAAAATIALPFFVAARPCRKAHTGAAILTGKAHSSSTII